MARAVFLLIAMLPLVLVVRLVLVPGVRRRLRGFPREQLVAGAAVALAGILGIVASGFAIVPLAIAAALSTAIIAYHAIQSRASIGTERGLPPGSLGLLPAEPWTDPGYYASQARRYGNIFKFRHFTRPAAAIVGTQRIAEFLRASSGSLTIPAAPFDPIVPGGFVRYLHGAEHDRIASLLRTAMSPAVVDSHSDCMKRQCDIALSSTGSGSSVAMVIEKMVSRIIHTLFLGLREEELDRFENLFRVADYRSLGRTGKARAKLAADEIIAALKDLARDNNRISFLQTLASRHPHAIDDDAVLGNFAYALHTGRIDATGLMTWVVAVAGQNTAWIERLRNCADADANLQPNSLADRFVRETLRLHQSEFLIRETTDDVVFEGYRIPAGWLVRLCIAESHRLEDAFEDAVRFNPDRFCVSQSRSEYAPFGFAPRACPGEHLTRAIGRHFLAVAASRYTLTVDAVEPLEFSGFHWQPNREMRATAIPIQ